MMEIIRTEEEIDRLESWAVNGQTDGTHYTGMYYEYGIGATLDWLLGRREESPADE
jgi:hypothetical protein